MRILNASVHNFGSYKRLDFDFENLGVALVYGPTGSGKSTLQDIIPWILCGRTAKAGSVDDIKNWNSDLEPTIGKLKLEINNQKITVTRVRGKSSENDLYWQNEASENIKHRGKDLQDSQKLLDEYLGMDFSFYCTASYFNESSDAGMFFLAKAKDKRQLFEKLTKLDFPVQLANKIIENKKTTKQEIEGLSADHNKYSGKYEQLTETKNSLDSRLKDWVRNHASVLQDLEAKSQYFDKEKETKIQALKTKSYLFEADKQKRIQDIIDKLDLFDQNIVPTVNLEDAILTLEKSIVLSRATCPTCKRPVKTNEKLEKLKVAKNKNDEYKERFADYSNKLLDLQSHENPYIGQLELEKKAGNHYEAQLTAERQRVNPYAEQIKQIEDEITALDKRLYSLKSQLKALEYKLSALNQLYDLSFELRAYLLKNVVKRIQMNTNSYLEKYFDSEFQVFFELEDADNLNVQITKNSHTCVYKQLSKGQQQLLKLCFSVAVMEAASFNIGTHFSLLSFDEALDGLDNDFKLKALNLFNELGKKHDSVIVIDHSQELQIMFSRKFKVSIIADESTIEEV